MQDDGAMSGYDGEWSSLCYCARNRTALSVFTAASFTPSTERISSKSILLVTIIDGVFHVSKLGDF